MNQTLRDFHFYLIRSIEVERLKKPKFFLYLQMASTLNPLETQYYEQVLLELTKEATASKLNSSKLRQVFFAFLNNLTEYEEKVIFTGWFAKINYIIQTHSLEKEEKSLYKLWQVLQNPLKYNSQEWQLWTIQEMTHWIQEFSTEPLSENLLSFLAENPSTISFEREEESETLDLMAFNFLSKSEEEQTVILKGYQANGVLVFIHLRNTYYSPNYTHRLTANARFLRAYQSIHLTHLVKIDTQNWASTEETLLIASPDYLVDASAIARTMDAKGEAFISLLDKLSFFQGNIHTFFGNIVNEFLDELIINEEQSFEEVYKKTMQKKRLESISYSEEEIQALYPSLKSIFPTIKKQVLNFRQEKTSLTAEPSFISAQYGLQGRLDLLVEFPESDRKDVIELKSSKSFPDARSPWIARQSDLLQVACYNLMLESTYPNRVGVSAIFYARDAQFPLRDGGKLNFEKQKAMLIRNRLVSLELELAKGNDKLFSAILPRFRQKDVPPFTLQLALNFQKTWEATDDLEKAYFSELMAFIHRELVTAKIGGTRNMEITEGQATLWNWDKQQKQEAFALLSELTIKSFEGHKMLLHLQRPASNSNVSNFREGDIITLYPDDVQKKPLENVLLKGHILILTPTEISLKLWTSFIQEDYFQTSANWAIEPSFLENTFRSLTASLGTFLKAPKPKRDLLLGKIQPQFDANFQVDYSHRGLNEEQNQILNQALSAKDYFLLQGPPGTGKTSQMLKNMVDHLYHQTEEVVVLLAFTNRATDEISQKVKSVCQEDFIRFGNLDESHPFWLQSLKSEGALSAMQKRLKQTRVFVSTVASFYNVMHLIPQKNTLIVDEASQLLEPHLSGILPSFQRFILIGDEKQLPAVVTQSAQQRMTDKEILKAIHLQDLGQSLFERLLLNAQEKNWQDCYAMLSYQFRTHQDIAQFINQYFYKTLKIGSPRQEEGFHLFDAHSEDELEQQLSLGRLLFSPTKSRLGFKSNVEEAQKVLKLLNTIRRVFQAKGSFDENTVGVITPYRAQIAEIDNLLDEELRKMISIDTVERFQGSEREIIIVSMVASSAVQMENLQSFDTLQTVDRKLNVTLSRAREQLIFLGNPAILQEGIFYRELLKGMKPIEV